MKKALVTGGTGYIGSWLVKYLLEDGVDVRITVRNVDQRKKYAFLSEIAAKSKADFEVYQADLLEIGSFDAAMDGIDTVFHVASPFTLKIKDPQKELIEPALKGTENVLTAVNKSSTVKRVVLTSSVAAIHGDNIDMAEKGITKFNETHWNSSSSLQHQPYSYSKTIAEQKAWEIANSQKSWKLAVINPSLVIGPALNGATNSGSFDVIKDLLSGKMRTGAPDLMFGFVDVRDVAKAHILAAKNPEIEGRYLLVERTMNMLELSKTIATQFPGKYKLPKTKAPKMLLKLIGGMFGVTPKFVTRNVGYKIAFDNSRSLNTLKLKYTNIQQSIKEMVESLQ